MKTFATLTEAREAMKKETLVSCIVELEHATHGRCFIGCRASYKIFAEALRQKPMSEIVRLYGEHKHTAPAAAQKTATPTVCRCDRCGEEVDPSTVHKQQQTFYFGGKPIRGTAYYCQPCANVLNAVGFGERTAMEERANAPYSRELDHPSDY